jgi:hypothetical protein
LTVPKLTRDQRERVGKLIWTHVDGVAENVESLIRAINADSLSGIRIVATDEWEKCLRAAKSLQQLLQFLEDQAPKDLQAAMKSKLKIQQL